MGFGDKYLGSNYIFISLLCDWISHFTCLSLSFLNSKHGINVYINNTHLLEIRYLKCIILRRFSVNINMLVWSWYG